jgi:iron complex transport system permease protein
MKNKWLKLIILLLLAAVALSLAVGLGSVSIPLPEQFSILLGKFFGTSGNYTDTSATILTTIRMPRAFLAFLVGGGLAVAGVVTQSILQNPLASSYTLGVSSGAALGAAIMTVMEISIPILGVLLLPTGGFLGGLLAVLFVMALSRKIDHGVSSHTVVLIGMIVSMFTNAIITLLSLLFIKHEHQIISWTMGSFNGKRWYHVAILLGADLIAIILTMVRHRELDALSFGDEHAASLGVNVTKVKMRQLILASLLTGISVCFTGTIGFVDLIAPHIGRKLIGATHKWMIPVSFLIGGILMTLADLIARTILSPMELPVGAVTALIGAPFFMYIYFSRRNKNVG